ncbi:MAG: cytochrome c biogenesis protein CcdA [Phycisphaerales bacterium]|jgi:thiol:disulfide interchange protein DsbD
MRHAALAPILALLALVLAIPTAAHGQAGSDTKVSVTAVAPRPAVRPGDRIPVAVILDIAPEWHVWTSEAQAKALPAGMVAFDAAIFTEITLQGVSPASAASAPGGIQWPKPHGVTLDQGDGPQAFAVYEGKAIAYVPVVVSDSASGRVELAFDVTVQACTDTCLAPSTIPVKLALDVRADAGDVAADPAVFGGFDPSALGAGADAGGGPSATGVARAAPIRVPLFGWDFELDPESGTFFPIMLLLAFVGGAILNFTPCVLPVVPLKIMGLAGAAGGERRRTFVLGAAMTAGVVGFWGVLGVLLSSVKGFEQSNQLFQYPAFTITVGAFIAVMAAGMAGFFTVGLPQWVYSVETKNESIPGSVIFGVMTAVLSTPCTAPLMGAAAGWAVTTKSPLTIIAVFLTIGLGMGAPYLVLSAYPQLAKRLPKSGPASDVLKQVMGLLLMAAAVYFIGAGINGYRTEPIKAHWWLIGALGVAAGLWTVWKALKLAKTGAGRATFVAAGVFIAVVSGAIPPVLTYERLPWKPYSAEALAGAMRDGDVAVLDFTAEWCINCKTFEKTILESDAVSAVLNEPGVALLKADITGKNAPGSAKLAELGRVTIPLLVVYAADGTETLKSEAYSAQQVIDAVRAAQQKRRR